MTSESEEGKEGEESIYLGPSVLPRGTALVNLHALLSLISITTG